MVSLNEVYRQKLIYYWCNCTGEINMPGYPFWSSPDPETLPPIAKNVYDNFWEEGTGAQEYVVTYNGETGLLLGWLFDYSWLSDLGLLTNDNAAEAKAKLHKAVKDAAEALTVEHSDTVFYGMGTDPDGDEILVFFSSDYLTENPLEAKHWLTENTMAIGDRLYKTVENAMK